MLFTDVGLMRMLQGQIAALAAFLIILAALYYAIRFFLKRIPDLHSFVLPMRVGVLAIACVAVVVFALNVFTRTAANRLPRSDVDRAGVYGQMNSNLVTQKR